MSKIIPLCSSSKGNSVYIGDSSSGILIDVGCSFKQLNELLSMNNLSLSCVKSLLITHEHSDHIKGLFQFTKHTNIPVYASYGTLDYIARNNNAASFENLYSMDDIKSINCDFEVSYFNTPHDANESVGYILKDNYGNKIAFCTDLGTVTSTVYNNVINSNIVFIESNYEPLLLKNNVKYYYGLKKRIASDVGHLSNDDCADFVEKLISNNTTKIILGHLSPENNTPETAYKRVVDKLTAEGYQEGYDYILGVAPIMSTGMSLTI